jgi:glucose/arabinose dehydrogenase
MNRWRLSAVGAMCVCAACGAASGGAPPDAVADAAVATRALARPVSLADAPFTPVPVATFDEPWALAFLPDGRLLVTEKKGVLRLVEPASGRVDAIGGLPPVDYGGQGGLGDVALHPRFASNGLVYLSYAEAGGDDTRGAAVARARLVLDARGGGTLADRTVIWRQQPKVGGRGHYGHRLLFGPDGRLWISSGERQKFTPAQDLDASLGKILRLDADGHALTDNPFAAAGGVAAQVWALGHRNPLGIAFDAADRLWVVEMGPAGGDELNLVERGANYGYPIVSNGDHYDGRAIPDHPTHPEFAAPALWWTPVISPSSLVIYSGTAFPDWRGDALISGLSSGAIVRVRFDGTKAREAERYEMGRRMRGLRQSPSGELWAIEDGAGGRLLRLVPRPR